MGKPPFLVHPRFVAAAAALQKTEQSRLWKQLGFFLRDRRHPSLNDEPVRGTALGIRCFRLSDSFRVIYRQREEDILEILAVSKHDEALRFAERWQPVTEKRAAPESLGFLTLPEISIPIEIPKLRRLVSARKYAPLARFLSQRTELQVRLSFVDIERILACTLPPSARRYRPWWANDRSRHVQALAWLEVGWQTTAVDLERESVLFVRVSNQPL